MQPEFRPIAISVVDFLGSFLPGCAWLLVFYEYDLMFRHHFAARNSFFAPLLLILSGSELLNDRLAIGTAYYLVLVLLAALLGFGIKPIVMRTAEWWSRPETWLPGGREGRFPYTAAYKKDKSEVFKSITEAVQLRTGFPFDRLPGSYEPFSACKRILRQLSSVLWEELEHAEAEARMLGSLFLAALASIVPVMASVYWPWILTWGLGTLGLGYGFRKARKREADYCYLNFLIVMHAVGSDEASVT